MFLLFTLFFLGHAEEFHFKRHAVYISVVEIEQNELRVKLFTDDLQDAIKNFSSSYKSDSEAKFCETNATSIEAYFNEKMKLTLNGQAVSIRLKGHSLVNDSYWLSFSFNGPTEWTSLKLVDSHFMELFPLQSNIVKVSYPKQRFGKLEMGKTTCEFSF